MVSIISLSLRFYRSSLSLWVWVKVYQFFKKKNSSCLIDIFAVIFNIHIAFYSSIFSYSILGFCRIWFHSLKIRCYLTFSLKFFQGVLFLLLCFFCPFGSRLFSVLEVLFRCLVTLSYWLLIETRKLIGNWESRGACWLSTLLQDSSGLAICWELLASSRNMLSFRDLTSLVFSQGLEPGLSALGMLIREEGWGSWCSLCIGRCFLKRSFNCLPSSSL